MKTNRQMKEELKFDLRVLPPPTVPVVSWADYADFRIMPTSLLKVAIEAADVARRSA
jgi:hypothetical protein